MTDESRRPKRRRWRRLIAGLILIVVSGSTWWNWPRGDARIAGRWGEFRDDSGNPQVVWDFRSNGVLEYMPVGGTANPVKFFWKLEDNEIRLGIPRSHPLAPAFNQLSLALYRVSGIHWSVHGSTWGIVPAGGEGYQLRRLDADSPSEEIGIVVLENP